MCFPPKRLASWHYIVSLNKQTKATFAAVASPDSLPQKEPLQGCSYVVQMAVTCMEGDTPQIKKTETQAVGYVETIVKPDKGQKPTLAGGGNSSRQSVRLYALIRDGIQ